MPDNKPATKTAAPAKTGATAIEVAAPKSATDLFVDNMQAKFLAATKQSEPWSPLKIRLAKGFAVKADMMLEAAEIKRANLASKANYQDASDAAKKAAAQPPFVWDNVDKDKLMVDAERMLNLGLDALLPNHVNIIFHLNSRTNLYDARVTGGYDGLLMAKPKFAAIQPKQVKIVMVFGEDEFDVEENEQGGERPVHKKATFFPPANALPVGGFGWIRYEDSSLDRVIVVDEYEFKKAMDAAPSKEFWGGDFKERKWNNTTKRYEEVGEAKFDPKVRRDMMYKTVAYRTLKHIQLDPSKIDIDTWLAVEESSILAIEAEVAEDIEANANTKELPPPAGVDTTTGEVKEPAQKDIFATE